MGNSATIKFTCPKEVSYYRVELWGENKICDGHKESVENGIASFSFRTKYLSDTKGAKTDDEGNIYIEGIKLQEGIGSYVVKVFNGLSGTQIMSLPLRVGPVIRGMSIDDVFTEDGLYPLDMYSGARLLYSYDNTTPRQQFMFGALFYGMLIKCKTECDVSPGLDNNSIITIENLSDDELEGDMLKGDLSSKLFLNISNPYGFIPFNKVAQFNTFKWEGYNNSLYTAFDHYEYADNVFMLWKETEHEEEWGPTLIRTGTWAPTVRDEAKQKQKGASVWNSVAEGWYAVEFGVNQNDNKDQVQKFRVNLEIKTEAHDEFIK